MKDPAFQEAFEEQNKRDYLANARFGSMVSIPLNLSCSVMIVAFISQADPVC